MEIKEKKTVLILYNKLFHYRIPIFNILSESVDLTVAYSIGKNISPKENLNFKVIKLPVLKYKRFVFHKNNIYKICQSYDVVIAYGDIAWLKLSTLGFHKKRNFKLIFWTIGVSASYDKKFDAISKWEKVRNLFFKTADALIFYSDYPLKKYIRNGFDVSKLFIACNTVEVNYTAHSTQKDIILFIGTLYMEKGLLCLLESYKAVIKVNPGIFPLHIIGAGSDFELIDNWIKKNELAEKIFLHGAIYDIDEKAAYFKRAIACISPFQAGLSVLESMGHGVSFITMHDSITGGERLNIKDGFNGVLLKETSDLRKVLLETKEDPEKFIKMGNEARKFYMEYRRPEHMAKGLLEAINYVLK